MFFIFEPLVPSRVPSTARIQVSAVKGRKEERKEGRKEGRKGGREEGRKERREERREGEVTSIP